MPDQDAPRKQMEAMLELFRHGEGWGQGEFGYDEHGRKLSVGELERAEKLCLWGAFCASSCKEFDPIWVRSLVVERLKRAVLDLYPERVTATRFKDVNFVEFNDHKATVFDDVEAVILRALELKED